MTRFGQRARPASQVTTWLPPPFTLLSLGPLGWWDASDTSTITSSSGSVSEWRDKSGNGFNMAQATQANQPTTGTRTQNGLNVLDFDGTDDGMVTTATTGRFRASRAYSVFLVAKSDRTNAAAEGLFIAESGSFDFQTGFLVERRTTNLNLHYGRGDSTNNYAQNLVANSSTSSMIIFQTVDGPNNSFSFRINDVVQNTSRTDGSLDPSGFLTQGSANHKMWAGRRLGGSFFDGFIGEVVIYDKPLAAADRSAVMQYLSLKWGITI